MEKCNPNDCTKTQLQLLYTSCVSEIAAFKDQQWKTTYYAILVYSAIVSVAHTINHLTYVEWSILIIAAIGVLCSARYIINVLEESIYKRRQRLTQIRKHFTADFMIAWSGGKPFKEIRDKPEKKSSLDKFFNAVMWFGFLATLWLIIREILNNQN